MTISAVHLGRSDSDHGVVIAGALRSTPEIEGTLPPKKITTCPCSESLSPPPSTMHRILATVLYERPDHGTDRNGKPATRAGRAPHKELGFDACIDHKAADFTRQLARPARAVSTSISKMSAARCSTQSCRCSTRTRGCRFAGWSRNITQPNCLAGRIA